jgi:hypothetical protein
MIVDSDMQAVIAIEPICGVRFDVRPNQLRATVETWTMAAN